MHDTHAADVARMGMMMSAFVVSAKQRTHTRNHTQTACGRSKKHKHTHMRIHTPARRNLRGSVLLSPTSRVLYGMCASVVELAICRKRAE